MAAMRSSVAGADGLLVLRCRRTELSFPLSIEGRGRKAPFFCEGITRGTSAPATEDRMQPYKHNPASLDERCPALNRPASVKLLVTLSTPSQTPKAKSNRRRRRFPVDLLLPIGVHRGWYSSRVAKIFFVSLVVKQENQ
jgi:hypothetical protein